MGVLTSKNTINTLGVAVNRTISHHLDNVIFFTGTRNRKVPHGMLVVSHGDERLIWNMFQNIKYILDHYINEYDWFYFVQDDAYTEADRLKSLVDHLSVDRELYMGSPEEFIGGEMEGKYCYGGFGYILSRSLLLRLQPFLENCRNDILSARPDEWLGRCIIDYTSTNCVAEFEVSGPASCSSTSFLITNPVCKLKSFCSGGGGVAFSDRPVHVSPPPPPQRKTVAADHMLSL